MCLKGQLDPSSFKVRACNPLYQWWIKIRLFLFVEADFIMPASLPMAFVLWWHQLSRMNDAWKVWCGGKKGKNKKLKLLNWSTNPAEIANFVPPGNHRFLLMLSVKQGRELGIAVSDTIRGQDTNTAKKKKKTEEDLKETW